MPAHNHLPTPECIAVVDGEITVCGRRAATVGVTAERLSTVAGNATLYAQTARESLVSLDGPKRKRAQMEHWDHLWWAYAFRLVLDNLSKLKDSNDDKY